MKEELNIAAILKGKPIGTKLWSPAFGDCELLGVSDYAEPIQVTTKSGDFCFRKNGKYAEEGEVCLFPSKRINTWSRFTWKKGDVLQISDIGFCTFEKWTSDDYTTFKGRYGVNLGKNSDGYYIAKEDLNTFLWCKVDDDNLIKQYLDEVEQQLGGKLNLETLEIEQPKPEFKDGDIVFVACEKGLAENTFIYKMDDVIDIHDEAQYYAAVFNKKNKLATCGSVLTYGRTLRLATDQEKHQLFSALAKEGKRWNPDTKQIEDLPKKCEFEPFQKVLARNNNAESWIATLFGFYDKEFEDYVCMGEVLNYCIPYNEETKHLLGTTDEWKGDEI